MREVGVLFVAFAPLDAFGWTDAPFRWPVMLTFLFAGVLLLGGALAMEVSGDVD